jgi:hypothetical protein
MRGGVIQSSVGAVAPIRRAAALSPNNFAGRDCLNATRPTQPRQLGNKHEKEKTS